MCQSLVNKVAQSEQLAAVAEPEILILFEDWLEELEKEVIEKVTNTDIATAEALADGTGLSRAGATFLLAKLRREGKIK
jgi:pyridoxine/pyridoxamine 5'-phosphate oxidase